MENFPDHIKLCDFLERERRTTVIGESLSAVLLSIAAILGTLASYAAIYFCAMLLLPYRLEWVAHLLASGYIAAVFLTYKNHDPESINELSVDTLDGRTPWSIWIPGVTHMSNLNMLSPWTIGSIAKIVAHILFAVPTCLGAARRAARKARATHVGDAASAVPFFALLLRKGKRVPYPELFALGDAKAAQSLSFLQLLNVAQHLPSEPAGMVILSTLRERLLGLAPSS
jgi:hypothetical protein